MEFGIGNGAAPADYLYGLPSADTLHIDEHCSSTTVPRQPASYYSHSDPQFSTSFADNIYIPSEEAAELEWLSNFVEDSFSAVPYPAASIPRNDVAASSSSTSSSDLPTTTRKRNVGGMEESTGVMMRRCTHCASEKTPQWRTGPLGAKTLCNACGVRYKSGRLVPEYRPASSPTFVLTRHSNSHRKVMELRRQKEVHHQRQPNVESAVYHHDMPISLS